MAAIVNINDGRRLIKWYLHGRECRVSFCRDPLEQVEHAKTHIEELIDAYRHRRPYHPSTRAWLETLADPRHAKLASYGLVARRTVERCQWLAGFADHVRRIKAAECGPSSLEAYEKPLGNLLAFFGDVLLERIDRAHVNAFRRWLRTSANKRTGGPLAESTANKRLKVCREFFGMAIEEGWLAKNPFSHLKGLEESARGPEVRKVYVPAAIVERVLEHATDNEWRLMVSLWRYAGLRATEPYLLRWASVNWDQAKMRVYAPKTKRWRWIPIWPEVAPYLREQFERAPDGSEWVIYGRRYGVDAGKLHAAGVNAYGRLESQIKQLAIETWPRLIQNLRTSGETDRINAGKWSAHTIAAWWGHGIDVQHTNYLLVTDDDYKKAMLVPECPTQAPDPEVKQ